MIPFAVLFGLRVGCQFRRSPRPRRFDRVLVNDLAYRLDGVWLAYSQVEFGGAVFPRRFRRFLPRVYFVTAAVVVVPGLPIRARVCFHVLVLVDNTARVPPDLFVGGANFYRHTWFQSSQAVFSRFGRCMV